METFKDNCLKLYQLMNQENYLQKLTDQLSEICDNPVLLMDYVHRVQSFCGKGTKNSETWNEMIETGYLNSARIQTFFHDTMKKITLTHKPLQIYYENETMILTPVLTNGTFMGLIAVLEISHPLKQDEIQYTQIVADILSLHCQSLLINDIDYEYSHHHIIIDLIENKIPNRKKLYERMYERDWKKANTYRILLADTSSFSQTYQKLVKDQCTHFWTQCKVLLYQEKILILEETEKNTFKNDIENWLIQFKVNIGISDTFHDLFDFSLHLNQASQSLLLGINHYDYCHIFYYDNYRLQDFFIQVNSILDTSTYYNSDVVKLKNYDKIHKSDLLKTLYTYFINDKSIQKTALELNVHKNTINYRIKKIKELFPKIFENNSQVFHVFLTYYLMKNK